MKELIELSLNPWVLPFTILSILSTLYWLLTLIGIVGSDAFDMDLDADLEGGGSFLTTVLQWMNATDVPVMLVLSVLSICKWLLNIVAILTINPGGVWWLGVLSWGIAFIVSCILTAVITRPLVPLFKMLKSGEDDEEAIVGMEATVVTATLSDTFGQVRVLRSKGASAQIHCRLSDGDENLTKGDKVTIVSRDDETGFFIAKQI